MEGNAALRTMFTKARESSVPLDTIERAVKRGTGELEGVTYESITYEGYGPAGVALLVECLTDNRNRTGAEVRSAFSKSGGNMAEPGAVSWQFERKGIIAVPKSVSEDDLMTIALDAGAEDICDQGDRWEVVTPPSALNSVRDALDEAKIPVDSSDFTMLSSNMVPLSEEGDVKKVLRLVDNLEDHDDVQNVYANFDVPDAVLEAVLG